MIYVKDNTSPGCLEAGVLSFLCYTLTYIISSIYSLLLFIFYPLIAFLLGIFFDSGLNYYVIVMNHIPAHSNTTERMAGEFRRGVFPRLGFSCFSFFFLFHVQYR